MSFCYCNSNQPDKIAAQQMCLRSQRNRNIKCQLVFIASHEAQKEKQQNKHRMNTGKKKVENGNINILLKLPLINEKQPANRFDAIQDFRFHLLSVFGILYLS